MATKARVLVIALPAGLLALAACSSGGGGDPPPVAPIIVALSATPSEVAAGVPTDVVWTWTYENEPSPAPSCTIDHGVGAVTSGGTTSVTLDAITTFTLTCSNEAGADTAQSTIVLEGSLAGATWSTVTTMPTPRASAATVAVGSKLYVFGGRDGFSPNIYTASRAVEIYDTVAGAWATGTPDTIERYAHAAAEVGTTVYVVGGHRGDYSLTTLVEAYDTTTDSWSTLAPLPQERYEHCAAAVDGKVYVISGTNGATYFDSIVAYDPGTNTWSARATMPRAHKGCAAVAVGTDIYVHGGIDAAGTYLRMIDVYDTVANAWRTLANEASEGGFMPAAALLRGHVVVTGGYQYGATPTVKDRAEALDVVAGTWQSLDPMPSRRYEHDAVTVGDAMYVVGGSGDVPRVGAVDVLR